MAFYNATDGDNWADNTGWLGSDPVGDWYGVTTNTGGRVTMLSHNFNQLSGSLPAALGNLDQLQNLYLSNNQLTGDDSC